MQERSTAGEPQQRYGYDEVRLVVENVPIVYGVPESYPDEMSRNYARKWSEAMKREMESLERLKIWEMAQLPKGQEFIQTKWVFDLKQDGKANMIRYKAR